MYHGLLALLAVGGAVWLGGGPGVLFLAAFVPLLARGFVGVLRLSASCPSMTRVGILESVYTLWFTGCMIGLLRLLPA